jgi:hypothetical protein
MTIRWWNWVMVVSLLLPAAGCGGTPGSQKDAGGDKDKDLKDGLADEEYKDKRTPEQIQAEEAIVVAALKKLGGFVQYDETLPGKPVFDAVIPNGKVDEALTVAKAFQGLRSLNFATDATDADLKRLKEFKGLTGVWLSGAINVTDVGMKELKDLKNLKTIILPFTQVTDEGLKELKALKKLQYLDVSKTKVTAAGVMDFKKALPDCRVVVD